MIATVAVVALVAVIAVCYDNVARHDGEMLKHQAVLQRLHLLAKMENQQQVFWRDHGVQRSDLVGVSDTMAYDRAFAKLKDRTGWRFKTLNQLDAKLAGAFERLSQAAEEATERRCLEFLPRMEAELAAAAAADVEAVQKRWMRACRARCTEDFERLSDESSTSFASR